MADIFRVHKKMDFFIYRHGHFSRHNVVSSIYVMFGIEAENVLRSFIDHLGMRSAKFSIRPRISEVKRKLPSLHLNWNGIGGRGRQIHVGPCLHAKYRSEEHTSELQSLRHLVC